MIPMKFIRSNPQLVREAIAAKREKQGDVDRLLALDTEIRTLQQRADELKSLRNTNSRRIGELQKQKESTDELRAEMKRVSEQIKELDQQLKLLQENLDQELLKIPNLPHPEVPRGEGEADNREVRSWGTPREFDFTPRDHLELTRTLNLLDLGRAARMSGSGFPLYTGNGARLERALINFMLDLHVLEQGYTEIFPPFMTNADAMRGTGQLPKLADDMYRVERDELFLIPTAEVPITNLHRGEILEENALPLRYSGYSACFRREAGSYGKETRGLLRLHQFNKVEMVKMVRPEDSPAALESLLSDAEAVLQKLGLHYRVVELCTADLSFAAARCYDLEVWAPGEGRYLEVSSCSNFEAFQARRANIRFRRRETGKVEFVHTLNASGVATPRLLVALLETHQNADGTVSLPAVLQPYLQGLEKLS